MKIGDNVKMIADWSVLGWWSAGSIVEIVDIRKYDANRYNIDMDLFKNLDDSDNEPYDRTNACEPDGNEYIIAVDCDDPDCIEDHSRFKDKHVFWVEPDEFTTVLD